MKRFNDFINKVNEQEELDFEVEPVGPVPGEMAAQEALPMSGEDAYNEFFHHFLEFTLQLKGFHWATESFAQHKASDETYEALGDALDTLVETMQGYIGRLNFAGQYTILNFADINTDEWIGSLVSTIGQAREAIPYSDVQNLLDELLGITEKFKYLLTLK
jgi:hypothetical protein